MITMQCDENTPGAYPSICNGHTIWLRDSHQGLVIDTYERNWHDDSDFYAVVWNADLGRPEHIEYATTRAWTYANGAKVDATIEVREAYDRWKLAHDEAILAQRREDLDATPGKDKLVIIVGGRKHKGKRGKCFWRGANQFRTYYRNGYNRPDELHNQRVGIITEDGSTIWTALENVRVVGHEDADLGAIFARKRT